MTNDITYFVFSERELTYSRSRWVHVRYLVSPVRLSSGLSVCRLSVMFVRSTQAVQIFHNISTALGTLAILRLWYSRVCAEKGR